MWCWWFALFVWCGVVSLLIFFASASALVLCFGGIREGQRGDSGLCCVLVLFDGVCSLHDHFCCCDSEPPCGFFFEGGVDGFFVPSLFAGASCGDADFDGVVFVGFDGEFGVGVVVVGEVFVGCVEGLHCGFEFLLGFFVWVHGCSPACFSSSVRTCQVSLVSFRLTVISDHSSLNLWL